MGLSVGNEEAGRQQGSLDARLRRLTPEELDADQLRLYALICGGPRADGPQAFPLVSTTGALEGPFNAMLLSPAVGEPLQQLGSAIRYATSLSPRAREIAILVVAVRWRSEFEWYAHSRVGRQSGLSELDLISLLAEEMPALHTPEEQCAYLVAREVVSTGHLSDDSYAQVANELGLRRLFELTTLIGYYMLLALQLRVFLVGSPDDDDQGGPPGPCAGSWT